VSELESGCSRRESNGLGEGELGYQEIAVRKHSTGIYGHGIIAI
jgi:hypothetical protein